MTSFQKEGIKIIDELASQWTQKYSHLTTFLEKNEKAYKLFFYTIPIKKQKKDFYVNSAFQHQINQSQ